MQIRLALRSSFGLTAYRSLGSSTPGLLFNSANSAPSVLTPGGLTGVFGGGQILDASATSGVRGLTYGAGGNVGPVTGFAVLSRIVPKFTGSPSTTQCLFSMGGFGGNDVSALIMYLTNTGLMEIDYFNSGGNLIVNQDLPGFVFTAGVATDIMFSWDGTTGAGKMKLSQDGVLVASVDVPAGQGIPDGKFKPEQMTAIYIGGDTNVVSSNYYLNEFLVFDYGENPVYATRTDFWPCAAFDYQLSTDPGASNVKSGVTYNFQATPETGTSVNTDPGQSNVLQGVTYTIDSVAKTGTSLSTDPGQANVLQGVTYSINSVSKTGSFIAPGASTDPGASNVKSGINYQINGSSETGTLVSTDPGQSNVLQGVTYTIESVGKTGTLLSTDPGVAHVQSGTAYTINSVAKTGTLVSTDPGQGNVLTGVTYTIENVAKTGTLENIVNELIAPALVGAGQVCVDRESDPIAFSQGDALTIRFGAQDGEGAPVNISGATFSTQLKGINGAFVTIPDQDHVIVSAVAGTFDLTLSAANSALCGVGSGKDIVTTITQFTKPVHYRGAGILTVNPATPAA